MTLGGYRAILIAGPTASGKSALAMTLAGRLDGVVVNADSMQVYRDLRVITARPTIEEEAHCSHVMFGHVDAAVNYSVARWLVDVRQAVARIEAEGHLPILVGGTGLYFRALLEGLSDIPAVPDAVRSELRDWAEGRPPSEIHDSNDPRDPLSGETLEVFYEKMTKSKYKIGRAHV